MMNLSEEMDLEYLVRMLDQDVEVVIVNNVVEEKVVEEKVVEEKVVEEKVVEEVVVEVVVEEEFDPENCCSICFNNFTGNNVNKCTTICGHNFHTGCLLQNGMYRNECPMCRHMLVETNVNVTDDEDDVSTIDDNIIDDRRTRRRRNDNDDENDDEDEDSNYDQDDDDEEATVDKFWDDADQMISNLLRLDLDIHNRHKPSLSARNYYQNKHNIRSNIVSSLSHLTDEEWKLAEQDILKTISKYYGQKKNEIWDKNEPIGLANTNLFTN